LASASETGMAVGAVTSSSASVGCKRVAIYLRTAFSVFEGFTARSIGALIASAIPAAT